MHALAPQVESRSVDFSDRGCLEETNAAVDFGSALAVSGTDWHGTAIQSSESRSAGAWILLPGIRVHGPQQLADHEYEPGQRSDDGYGLEHVIAIDGQVPVGSASVRPQSGAVGTMASLAGLGSGGLPVRELVRDSRRKSEDHARTV